MIVDTLTQDTKWLPGAGASVRDAVAPDVSLLLVVSCSDLAIVSRAIESALAQSELSLEVIVVDDSGDTATASWIDDVCTRDGRLSVLRHQSRIGIPAIGWVEAWRRARGGFFVLAREEDEFDRGALAHLLEAQKKAQAGCENAIVYGFVETQIRDLVTGEPIAEFSTDRGKPAIMLRVSNFVGRNTALIPRAAFDLVGCTDPHVLLAQVSEWDLWRRLANYFQFQPVDVAIGVRHPSSAPSELLEVDRWAIEEWMRTERDHALKRESIANYDVVAAFTEHGWPTRAACAFAAQALGFPAEEELAETMAAAPPDDQGYILVVTVQYDASVALYFDMLPEPLSRRVLVVPNEPDRYLNALGRATALVVVRAVRVYQSWIDAARTLDVPAYYFLDDNMSVLAEKGEAMMHTEDFSKRGLKESLRPFAGALLSSNALVDYFRRNELHTQLSLFPVACARQDEEQARAAHGKKHDADEIVVAFMGGFWRSKGLWDVLIPALSRFASEGRKIHFVAPGLRSNDDGLDKLPPSLRVTLLPWSAGYLHVVQRFARFAPDFMLLAPGETANNQYKTLHPVLTARLLNAVAVLPRIPPYLEIEDRANALVVENPFDIDAWHATLRGAVDERFDREAILARNRTFCAEAFSGNVNRDVLLGILRANGGAPSWARQYHRLTALLTTQGSGTTGVQHEVDEALRRNAEELLALRRNRRFSWRHRILARPNDLWAHCAPAFLPLQRDAVKYGWKRRDNKLEYSDSLHDKAYHDYELTLPDTTLGGVSLAIATDGPKQAKFKIQLISPSGKLAASAIRELRRIDLNQPVSFHFPAVQIQGGQVWRLRLSCASTTPVYVFELTNRTHFQMLYGAPSPFIELLEPSGKIPVSAAPVSNDAAGIGEERAPTIKVKMIVEGDIPTNQIIGRLITEALGELGSVEKILVTDFTPMSVLDGGLVLLSRIASPAAEPMLQWMALHGIPYLYYIDDNFWELKGDSPVAQFYQFQPVRWTLSRAIKGAKAVIVNSALLGEYIKKMFPRTEIVHLNAPFDFSLVENTAAFDKGPGEVRIGFAGSITRAPDFVEILPAFQRLLDCHAHVSLTFFGYCPPELRGRDRVSFVEPVVDYAEFIALKASQALDIGIAPMTASTANLYKTNNKYREYGGLKIAGVYTNSSPYKETVIDGKTGLLVEHTTEAWFNALERLVTDTDLRESIAEAAYEDVRLRYAQSVVATQWRTMLCEFSSKYGTGDPIQMPDARTLAMIRTRQRLGRIRLRAIVGIGRVKTMIASRVTRVRRNA
ncbi:glycosyltransferase [Caballeronia telluris]|uniref:Glycosyltransferase-like protein n=1 Tax=Caballeronia telluris TaxID=326475 RepID=A0A158IZ15_9BURK|nr:glycosyltransferase [Caballeronia telluris]SAL61503.1 glycosyltransferase-like protein [Caballeronia telluris]